MSNHYPFKQVILMRTDLRNTQGQKVRSSKLMAQAAHAAMMFLSNKVQEHIKAEEAYCFGNGAEPGALFLAFTAAEKQWLRGSFAKIILAVDSLEQLIELVDAARARGLHAEVCTDAGATEFGNVPTITCAAIGPAESETVDLVTGHLKTL